MFKLLLGAVLIMSSVSHADTKVGIMGSLLWSTTQNDKVDDIEGSKEESRFNPGGGLRALVGLNDRLYLRTGASIIGKAFRYDFNGPQITGAQSFVLTYLSIPATLYVKASPQFGIFGGTAIQAKIDDKCTGSYGDGTTTTKCRIEDDNTLVLPAIIGFDVVVTEKFSVELSYEYALMETMKDTKVSSAVASMIYNF